MSKLKTGTPDLFGSFLPISPEEEPSEELKEKKKAAPREEKSKPAPKKSSGKTVVTAKEDIGSKKEPDLPAVTEEVKVDKPAETVTLQEKKTRGRHSKSEDGTTTISIRISNEMYEQLQTAKWRTEGNMTRYIEEIIRKDLEKNFERYKAIENVRHVDFD